MAVGYVVLTHCHYSPARLVLQHATETESCAAKMFHGDNEVFGKVLRGRGLQRGHAR